MNNNNEIRVKVNGGYLVAGRNADPNYDGIYVVFETDEGTIIDIVLTEAKSEYNKELIDVYCYENVYNIKSSVGGFRTTTLNMSKENRFENLYMN